MIISSWFDLGSTLKTLNIFLLRFIEWSESKNHGFHLSFLLILGRKHLAPLFFFSSPLTKHTLKVSLWNSCLYFPYQLVSMANKLEIREIIILGSLPLFFFSINLIFIIFNYLLLKKKDINNFKNTKYPHQEK